jgi:hypothetical protein
MPKILNFGDAPDFDQKFGKCQAFNFHDRACQRGKTAENVLTAFNPRLERRFHIGDE